MNADNIELYKVRIGNEQNGTLYGSGVLYVPAKPDRFAYVFTAGHVLDDIPSECKAVSILINNGQTADGTSVFSGSLQPYHNGSCIAKGVYKKHEKYCHHIERDAESVVYDAAVIMIDYDDSCMQSLRGRLQLYRTAVDEQGEIIGFPATKNESRESEIMSRSRRIGYDLENIGTEDSWYFQVKIKYSNITPDDFNDFMSGLSGSGTYHYGVNGLGISGIVSGEYDMGRSYIGNPSVKVAKINLFTSILKDYSLPIDPELEIIEKKTYRPIEPTGCPLNMRLIRTILEGGTIEGKYWAKYLNDQLDVKFQFPSKGLVNIPWDTDNKFMESLYPADFLEENILSAADVKDLLELNKGSKSIKCLREYWRKYGDETFDYNLSTKIRALSEDLSGDFYETLYSVLRALRAINMFSTELDSLKTNVEIAYCKSKDSASTLIIKYAMLGIL